MSCSLELSSRFIKRHRKSKHSHADWNKCPTRIANILCPIRVCAFKSMFTYESDIIYNMLEISLKTIFVHYIIIFFRGKFYRMLFSETSNSVNNINYKIRWFKLVEPLQKIVLLRKCNTIFFSSCRFFSWTFKIFLK